MDFFAAELLRYSVGAKHEAVCWFDYRGKRYVGRWADPPSMDYIMRSVEETRKAVDAHLDGGSYEHVGYSLLHEEDPGRAPDYLWRPETP